MSQVQWTLRILLDAEVQSLNTSRLRTIRRILKELETCPSESILLLEDALVGKSDLDGGVLLAIESRRRAGGELEDGRPLEVIALDVIRVVEFGSGVGVEISGRSIDGNAAFEDDGAFYFGALGGGRGEGGARCEQEGGDGVHDEQLDDMEPPTLINRKSTIPPSSQAARCLLYPPPTNHRTPTQPDFINYPKGQTPLSPSSKLFFSKSRCTFRSFEHQNNQIIVKLFKNLHI